MNSALYSHAVTKPQRKQTPEAELAQRLSYARSSLQEQQAEMKRLTLKGETIPASLRQEADLLDRDVSTLERLSVLEPQIRANQAAANRALAVGDRRQLEHWTKEVELLRGEQAPLRASLSRRVPQAYGGGLLPGVQPMSANATKTGRAPRGAQNRLAPAPGVEYPTALRRKPAPVDPERARLENEIARARNQAVLDERRNGLDTKPAHESRERLKKLEIEHRNRYNPNKTLPYEPYAKLDALQRRGVDQTISLMWANDPKLQALPEPMRTNMLRFWRNQAAEEVLNPGKPQWERIRDETNRIIKEGTDGLTSKGRDAGGAIGKRAGSVVPIVGPAIGEAAGKLFGGHGAGAAAMFSSGPINVAGNAGMMMSPDIPPKELAISAASIAGEVAPIEVGPVLKGSSKVLRRIPGTDRVVEGVGKLETKAYRRTRGAAGEAEGVITEKVSRGQSAPPLGAEDSMRPTGGKPREPKLPVTSGLGRNELLAALEREKDLGSRLFLKKGAYELTKKFIESLPEELLDHASIEFLDELVPSRRAARAGQRPVGRHNAYTGLIQIARNLSMARVDPTSVPATVAHEIAHHLQRFMTEDDFRALWKQYEREVRRGGAAKKGEYYYSSFSEWWAHTIEDLEYYRNFAPGATAHEKTRLKQLIAMGHALYNQFLHAAHRFYLRRGMRDHAGHVYAAMKRGERAYQGTTGPGVRRRKWRVKD